MRADISDNLQLITPATHSEYRQIVAPLASASWPEFMLHDAVADVQWGALFERFSDYQFGLLDLDTGRAAAMGNSLPLRWEDDLGNLPERGWDWAFEHAVQDHRNGALPTIQCAIQVAIHPSYQGKGLSTRMIDAMREIGRSKGFKQLIAPVRPSQKSLYQLTDIDRYVGWKRADGSVFDAWLRVHARLGAKVVKVCHESMTICGAPDEWTEWTNLSFPESGQYIVSGAMNPISMDLAAGLGTYVEPNVWMVHNIA